MKKIGFISLLLVLTMVACGKKTTEPAQQPTFTIQQRVVGGETYALPKATAFKMNGDYSNNVAVTLGPDGRLLYFPAPTDIRENSAPYDLGNGWWLNRQGLSSNSVFTKWTFKEYSKLKNAPSPQEIMDAIIPGSGVTEMISLPVSISDALANPAGCKKYL